MEPTPSCSDLCPENTVGQAELPHTRHRTPMAVESPLKSLEHTQEYVSMDINTKCFTHLSPQIWPYLSVLPWLGLEGKERTSWPADALTDVGEACAGDVVRAGMLCLHLDLWCPLSVEADEAFLAHVASLSRFSQTLPVLIFFSSIIVPYKNSMLSIF